jgi:PhnB protein
MVMADGATSEAAPYIYELYPHLHVRDGAAAIDFYKRIFGAEELMRLAYPDGRIAHAELKLGPLTILLADEHPEYGVQSPLAFGGTGSSIHLHVDDVDRLARRAMEAGATMVRAPMDEGHGERQCRIRDPFGHEWLLGHQVEDLTPEEIRRRFEAEVSSA